MTSNIKNDVFADSRRGNLIYDFLFATALTAGLYAGMQTGMLPFSLPACEIPLLKTGNPDLMMDALTQRICRFPAFIRLGSYVMVPYILISIGLIVSPLRGTFLMRLRGRSLERLYDGGAPRLLHAARLVLFSPGLVPIYFLILYFAFHDYAMSLHQQTNGMILMGGLAGGLTFLSRFFRGDVVLDERISGLRVVLNARAQKRLEKKSARRSKRAGWWRAANYWVGPTMMFIIFGAQSFNVLREGETPAQYLKLVYERPPTQWQDNAYFALAGLDAPAQITDSYEYGRQEVIHYAADFARFRQALGIPYTQDVPEAALTLYNPADQALGLDDTAARNWSCLYALPEDDSPSDREECPDAADLDRAIASNRILYDRFKTLPSFAHFSQPSHFLEQFYPGQDFLNLARMIAAQTVVMNSTGQPDQAADQWVRFTMLYRKMLASPETAVDRAVYMVALTTQFSALERMLYHHPELARERGKAVLDALAMNDVSEFRAAQLLVDDWRNMEPWLVSAIGGVPFMRRQMLEVLTRFDELAKMSAAEQHSTSIYDLYGDLFPRDPEEAMKRAFLSPGNPVTNMIVSLLITGQLKGSELLTNMHRIIARARLAVIAIRLIQDDVPADGAAAYVENLPAQLHDPFTKTPFKWDARARELYSGFEFYPGDSYRSVRFRVNLP